MFGFLDPGSQDIQYRSIYARCCQLQHQHYGVMSLPLHTYESVFIYLCCIDAQSIDKRNVKEQRCCRLSCGTRLKEATDSSIGMFTASASLLLALTKLDDDIRDRRSYIGRVAKRLLSRRIERSLNYFNSLDPQFRNKMAEIFFRQSDMESRPPIGLTIEQYSRPSSDAFAYLFRLLAGLPKLSDFAGTLEGIGANIGAATVAFDCASDWKADKKRGQVNPVRNADEAIAAMAFAQANVHDAAEICKREFGKNCGTSNLLHKVYHKICRSVRKSCEREKLSLPVACLPPHPLSNSVTLHSGCCGDCVESTGSVGCFCLCGCFCCSYSLSGGKCC